MQISSYLGPPALTWNFSPCKIGKLTKKELKFSLYIQFELYSTESFITNTPLQHLEDGEVLNQVLNKGSEAHIHTYLHWHLHSFVKHFHRVTEICECVRQPDTNIQQLTLLCNIRMQAGTIRRWKNIMQKIHHIKISHQYALCQNIHH